MVTFWPFQTTASQHWQNFSSNAYLAVNRSTGAPSPLEANFYLVDQTNAAARAAVCV